MSQDQHAPGDAQAQPPKHKRNGPRTFFFEKHALNPPIVTIIGAGVTGLTVAHELAERGFLVQVVEKEEDPEDPGKVLVGGMAASQYGRIPPTLEQVHGELLGRARGRDAEASAAIQLLELFQIQRHLLRLTSPPARLPPLTPDANTDRIHAWVEALTAVRNERFERYVRHLADLALRGQDTEEGQALSDQLLDSLEKGSGTEQHADLARVLSTCQWQIFAGSGFGELVIIHRVHAEAFVDLAKKHLPRDILLCRVKVAKDSKLASKLQEELQSQGMAAHVEFREPTDSDSDALVEIVERKLPGEHGYRFFPSFYSNLFDTMKRTPLRVGRRTTHRSVFDNLFPTTQQSQAIEGQGLVDILRRRPESFTEFRQQTTDFMEKLGITRADGLRFQLKLFRYLITSPRRRVDELDEVSWREFVQDGGFTYSNEMTKQIEAASQALNGFSVDDADAHTYGNIAVQLLLDLATDGSTTDMVLNGPTSEAWLDKWKAYLKDLGVRFFLGEVETLKVTGGELVPVFKEAPQAEPGRDPQDYLPHNEERPGSSPDFYVLALPLAPAVRLVDAATRSEGWTDLRTASEETADEVPENRDFDRLLNFAKRSGLASETPQGLEMDFARDEDDGSYESGPLRDMVGLQLYYGTRQELGEGHLYLPKSAWGLSAITQSDQWLTVRPGGDQAFLGLISVDICDAHTAREDGHGDVACKATPSGLASGVVDDLLTAIHGGDEEPTTTSWYPDFCHIDQGLTVDEGNGLWTNHTPFLASVKGDWQHRPGATRIEGPVAREVLEGWPTRPRRRKWGSSPPSDHPSAEYAYSLNARRWVLAGTHMAHHTRMTTMEAANESGRHASNAVIRALVSDWNSRRGEAPQALAYNFGRPVLPDYGLVKIFDPEDREIPDLRALRDLDDELWKRNVPHLFDVLQVEAHVNLWLEGEELAKRARELGATTLRASAIKDPTRARSVHEAVWEVLEDALPDDVLHDPAVRGFRTQQAEKNLSLLLGRLQEGGLGDLDDLLGRSKHKKNLRKLRDLIEEALATDGLD